MATYLTPEEIEKFKRAGWRVYQGTCPVCGQDFTREYPKTDDGLCIACDMDLDYPAWI